MCQPLQAALDKENASLAATGEPPKLTKFETDKEKLRHTIRTALSSAISFEDFSRKLLQQGVTVQESRERLSYLTLDRTKPITARKLGDDFDRAAVEKKGNVRELQTVKSNLDKILRREPELNIIPLGSHQFPASEPSGNGIFHLQSHHNILWRRTYLISL